jgi:hypothetical protein
MLTLKQDALTDSGFYFMSYYPSVLNSIGAVEMTLQQIKITPKDAVIIGDKETASGYPDALFSQQLPDYVTTKFAKALNSFMMAYNFDVKIELVTNDAVGYDETLSAFIRPNNESVVLIVTQHINGQVDQTILRGQASLKALKEFI